jgi:serine protease
MDKLSRLAGMFACAAVVATAGCATSNSAAPGAGSLPMQSQVRTQSMTPAQAELQRLNTTGPDWRTENGVTFHRPHYMGTVQSAGHDVKPAIQLVYGNGPVLTKPKMYLIFWGFKAAGDPNKVKALLKAYGHSIGGSKYDNIYTQYTGPQGHIKDQAVQFGGAWADDVTPIPTHPTDGQVAAESLLGVTHFGYDPNGSYVVATAHLHSSQGFGSSFCAYHSATSSGGNLVSYTDLPYMPDAGSSCGSNIVAAPSDELGTDEGVTIVEGHEYGESVTDPNPPSGWYNQLEGEIGDICAWQNIQNDPFKKKSYTAQPMFSNASSSCVHSYP